MHGSLFIPLALLLALGGCSSKPAQESQGGASEAAKEQPKAEPAARRTSPRRFDAEGRLIPSDDYIVGIRLPRGAELYRQDGLLHVYRVRAPIGKVLAYIGPMMITGSVERRGKGAVYKRASVRGAEVNPTKVDVSILEVASNTTRISIMELPPPAPREQVPSADRTKAAARESFRTLD
ncbi:MAG: hypothetical protein HKN10_05090 [Myxococcales bacterium]|nr:hypothetical protein [Myxococcales bacterium]